MTIYVMFLALCSVFSPSVAMTLAVLLYMGTQGGK